MQTQDMSLEQEILEYEESFEALDAMFTNGQQLHSVIQNMLQSKRISVGNVASLESIYPGMILDNPDIAQSGGPFHEDNYTVSVEQAMQTEAELAVFLMGKFFKLNVKGAKILAKNTVRLANIVSTFAADKSINGRSGLLGTSVDLSKEVPSINFKSLPQEKQDAVIKLTEKYTGGSEYTEADVAKVLGALKVAKNGIEIMSKVFMPKYSGLLIPLFYISQTDYSAVIKFFDVMDNSVLPKIDTNLNMAMMQISGIVESRDWVALSKFNTSIFGAEDKQHVYALGTHLKVNVSNKASFKRKLGKIRSELYKLLSDEVSPDKNDPKYHQNLPKYVSDLDQIKDNILSISDTMSDMTKHADSRTGALTRDLRKFRASKTVKESVKSGRHINKYSNAAYSRVLKEMRDVAALSAFMARAGNDVINAYTKVYSRSNALNVATVKYLEKLNKIVGE